MIPEHEAVLLTRLTPSKADPRASAVENDNLLIPVHCPGGPFDQGSAVAASFQGTERVQAGTLCQNISDCLMSFPISPQTSTHCTNCIHQIFHSVLTSLFILQQHFTARMRKEHLGAKILSPFTREIFPKPRHSQVSTKSTANGKQSKMSPTQIKALCSQAEVFWRLLASPLC